MVNKLVKFVITITCLIEQNAITKSKYKTMHIKTSENVEIGFENNFKFDDWRKHVLTGTLTLEITINCSWDCTILWGFAKSMSWSKHVPWRTKNVTNWPTTDKEYSQSWVIHSKFSSLCIYEEFFRPERENSGKFSNCGEKSAQLSSR